MGGLEFLSLTLSISLLAIAETLVASEASPAPNKMCTSTTPEALPAPYKTRPPATASPTLASEALPAPDERCSPTITDLLPTSEARITLNETHQSRSSIRDPRSSAPLTPPHPLRFSIQPLPVCRLHPHPALSSTPFTAARPGANEGDAKLTENLERAWQRGLHLTEASQPRFRAADSTLSEPPLPRAPTTDE